MLHVFINQEEVAISIEGTGKDITAEVALLIGCIYRKLRENDADIAEAYKMALKKCMEENVPFKTNDEMAKEMIDLLKKALREADN